MSHAIEHARKFFALSCWRDSATLNEDAVTAALEALKANPLGYAEVNEHGAIGGLIAPLWFDPDTLVAAELFWYSEMPGEGRALRQRFEAWAKANGAKFVQLSAMVNENEERLRRTLTRGGYDAKEIGLIKEL